MCYNENKYSHLRTLEDCLMHDYPNLMTIMRMRGKLRKDCAKAIGCNRTTLYKKLRGQADWRLQECLPAGERHTEPRADGRLHAGCRPCGVYRGRPCGRGL